MVSSKAATVSQYLDELPPERRKVIQGVRKVMRASLPTGFKEGMLYGMICYFIPLKDFPETYNGQPLVYAGLAAQKNYYSVYLNNIYSDPEAEAWFAKRYAATGRDMAKGKSCINFKKLDDLPLELIAEALARNTKDEFIEMYEDARTSSKRVTKK